MSKLLNISIVLYRTPEGEWQPLVKELQRSRSVNRIYLIDNSPEPLPEQELSAVSGQRSVVTYRHPGKNLGYGTAHNIAIRETIYDEIPFHLVMNSDT